MCLNDAKGRAAKLENSVWERRRCASMGHCPHDEVPKADATRSR
jgi:hypothetical protein